MSNELLPFDNTHIEKINPVKVFAEDGLDTLLKQMEEHYRSIVLDPTTPKGREEIRSVAFKITKNRTALFDKAKNLTEDWRVKTKAVNDERGRMEKRLLALEEEIRRPLTEFENREKQRVAEHERQIELIKAPLHGLDFHATQDQIREAIEMLPSSDRDFEEFQELANAEMTKAKAELERRLQERIKHDDDQAELERLRAQEKERQEQEERDRIAKDAAEAARKQAEAEAAIELIWEQAHRDNSEWDKAQAERDRQAAQERAETAEYLAMYSEAESDNRLFDAELRRLADVAAAEQRAADNAWLATYAEAERDNQAFDEQARKERNTRHKGKINREVLAAIQAVAPLSWTEQDIKNLIGRIAKGEIDYVSIQY